MTYRLRLLGREPVSDSPFPVSEQPGVTVVTTPDEIDISNASLLREAMHAAALRQSRVVAVDMTGTEFCDSTGLNVLVRAQKQAQQEGREVCLAVRGSALLRILAVSGVGSIFRIYDSLADALDVESAEPAADPVAPGHAAADQV